MFVHKECLFYGKQIKENDVQVPFSVPLDKKDLYIENFLKITKGTGRLFLFVADHKIEHLNKDFWNLNVPCDHDCPDVPSHLFEIASNAQVGGFCSQFGLICRMAGAYREINYVIKINSKTDISGPQATEPLSRALCTVGDVVRLKNEHKINVCGVGYTIYLGSTHEAKMLAEGSRVILDAHKEGFVTVLWIYPRGASIADELDENIIAGAAGVGAALGADFVKVRVPRADTSEQSAQRLLQATRCAGNTGVICAGGPLQGAELMIKTLYEQIKIGKTAGCAIGRNIYQRPFDDAMAVCKAISGIVYGNLTLEGALDLVKNISP